MATRKKSKVVIDLLLSDDDDDDDDDENVHENKNGESIDYSNDKDSDSDSDNDEIFDARPKSRSRNHNIDTNGKRRPSKGNGGSSLTRKTSAATDDAATAVSPLSLLFPVNTITNKNSNNDRGVSLGSGGCSSDFNRNDSDSKPVPKSNNKTSKIGSSSIISSNNVSSNRNRKSLQATAKAKATKMVKTTTSQGLQAGLVLEEDIFAAFPQTETTNSDSSKDDGVGGDSKTTAGGHGGYDAAAEPFVLFEDKAFGPVASSIQGMHRISIADADTNWEIDNNNRNKKDPKQQAAQEKWRPKCRCGLLSILSFKEKDNMRPYFRCGKTTRAKKCQFFEWAFQTEFIPWYRFGSHNDHALVRPPPTTTISAATILESSPPPPPSSSIFSAQDLVQGKVGDCWFLSALAVVAERSDLVERLFRKRPGQAAFEDDQRNIVRVNLFLDGIWTPIVMDTFLPCSIGGGIIYNQEEEELELQRAIEASLLNNETSKSEKQNSKTIIRNPYAKPKKKHITADPSSYTQQFPTMPLARNDPHGLSENNVRIMKATANFLREQCNKNKKGDGQSNSNLNPFGPRLLPEGCLAQTQDLAYSKARRNQLWVPFLEKAYAKIHGSYKAISGGHIAEAFLDLTGAPTLQIGWHASRAASVGSSTLYQDPKSLWEDLKKWRSQRLPMGCGTDRSAVGLIGMHAYSILDVREVPNVGVDFFRDRLLGGTLGNVSGFTEYDGKVRLLRVRNPHGRGEWKGEFSDKCQVWEKLMVNSGITLPRTMANDGTFWIGYDDFLLGFSNVDVVLAHIGNHAKSFVSNFPPKKSNHRCQRAFEVSLIDPQPGLETKERVEVFVMGIQKSRRGARQGRADRKKSYKVSDFGILVGEYPLEEEAGQNDYSAKDENNNCSNPFSAVHGQMFGFQRNGHYKLVLDRRHCKRLVVMPISFGHPAATDEFLSFVVRFNADAPLMIRELEKVPRMDRVLGDFLVLPKPSGHFRNTRQGQKTVLWANRDYKVVQIDCRGNHGGTVFVYLCAVGVTATDSGTKTKTTSLPANEYSLSLSIEATCRGMSCRVEGELLDHETISKGKKFQAAWRKFGANVSIGPQKSSEIASQRSRLLMVIYQSGQDTEMGSITCKPMGRVLSARNDNNCRSPTKAVASATLDRYWKTGSKIGRNTYEEESCIDRYEELGVFHPITLGTDAFRRCGSNYENASSNTGSYEPIREEFLEQDENLETALALSRQEQDVTVSIRADDNGNGDGNDNLDCKLSVEEAMLQEALRRSCHREHPNNGAAPDTNNGFTYETELEDALRRSRQETGGGGGNNNKNNNDDYGNNIHTNDNDNKVLDLIGDEGNGNLNSAKHSYIANCSCLETTMIDLTATTEAAMVVVPANSNCYEKTKTNANETRRRNKRELPAVLDLTDGTDTQVSASLSKDPMNNHLLHNTTMGSSTYTTEQDSNNNNTGEDGIGINNALILVDSGSDEEECIEYRAGAKDKKTMNSQTTRKGCQNDEPKRKISNVVENRLASTSSNNNYNNTNSCSTNGSNVESREKKRKLAAGAAIKRLQRLS